MGGRQTFAAAVLDDVVVFVARTEDFIVQAVVAVKFLVDSAVADDERDAGCYRDASAGLYGFSVRLDIVHPVLVALYSFNNDALEAQRFQFGFGLAA